MSVPEVPPHLPVLEVQSFLESPEEETSDSCEACTRLILEEQLLSRTCADSSGFMILMVCRGKPCRSLVSPFVPNSLLFLCELYSCCVVLSLMLLFSLMLRKLSWFHAGFLQKLSGGFRQRPRAETEIMMGQNINGITVTFYLDGLVHSCWSCSRRSVSKEALRSDLQTRTSAVLTRAVCFPDKRTFSKEQTLMKTSFTVRTFQRNV